MKKYYMIFVIIKKNLSQARIMYAFLFLYKPIFLGKGNNYHFKCALELITKKSYFFYLILAHFCVLIEEHKWWFKVYYGFRTKLMLPKFYFLGIFFHEMFAFCFYLLIAKKSYFNSGFVIIFLQAPNTNDEKKFFRVYLL